MSPSTKIRILEECSDKNHEALVQHIKTHPIIKITGDNLDIHVRSSRQGLDRQHKDMHMFASNVLSTRISSPDIDNQCPQNNKLDPCKIVLHGFHADILMLSYKILLSRIVCKDEVAYKWMDKVTPKHIPNPYQTEMAQQTKIFQLPLQMKNEAKYEDCVEIMNSYEQSLSNDIILNVCKLSGTTAHLDEFKVITGGDQLTRVRLEGAKDLKRLSTTPVGRLEHIHPLVCELWHLKQDLLEKLFKRFYNKASSAQPCTLSFFKIILKKSDVSLKVKSNFRAHFDFLTMIVKEMIREQFLEVIDGTHIDIPDNISKIRLEAKKQKRDEIIQEIISSYGYDFTTLNSCNDTESDELFNYCCQLCQWGLHIIALNDTAQEGDIMRVIPNLMRCIPLFFSHSKLSKYMVECIDIIMKCENASPLERTRILEGFFVNKRGGQGNNVEADLVQEHAVRNQKDLIRALGANKSEKAMLRATGAANLVTSIVDSFDDTFSTNKKSGHHGEKEGEKDIKAIRQCLRSIRPFKKMYGRQCPPFRFKEPTLRVDNSQLMQTIKVITDRLHVGMIDTSTTEGEEIGENEGLPEI
ncbi:hypothetical protein FSP39_007984 [Pinctada imbricata]|uniref:DUF6589 domain-containing protein n=1 Tax=Pinctada imbricata TaxID=66713 RepID=A0AA88YHV3_PINIB|nr:hypothetical protein FSP39_007984 [Pinctada imbricata]